MSSRHLITNSNGAASNGQERLMVLLSAEACHLDRQRLEVVRVRRSVRQQQRQQQCGFRLGKSAQDALREAWIATMWVRRMCREAMRKMITSPAAE